MPSVPTQTTCQELGCTNPRSRYNVFCVEHGGRNANTQIATEERKAFNSAYQTKFWRIQRVVQLSKQPICQCCLTRGVVTPAEHVDHVFPWAQIGRRAFERNLFQSLCQSCHSHKTSLESKGVIMHYADGIAHEFRLTDYARVVQGTA